MAVEFYNAKGHVQGKVRNELKANALDSLELVLESEGWERVGKSFYRLVEEDVSGTPIYERLDLVITDKRKEVEEA